MAFGKEAAAALVFAVLYFAMWCYMTGMYATKRYKWKSRFTILYLHCIIRVVSQACGVAFGILVWKNVDVFVAYLILSAEGYFSLTIASYYFLKHYEIGHLGSSNLGPAVPPKNNKTRRIAEAFSFLPIVMPWKYWHDNLIALVDSWLIPANAIIIAGGSMMVNANSKDLSPDEIKKRMNTAKALRTAGQSIFLALTLLYVVLLVRLGIRLRRTNPPPRYSGRVLALFDYSLSYYNGENYTAHGFTDRFIALEYCLAVVTEFSAAALLNVSYWGSRHLSTENPTHGSGLELDEHSSKEGSFARDGLGGGSKA